MKERDPLQFVFANLSEAADVVRPAAESLTYKTKPILKEIWNREVMIPFLQSIQELKGKLRYRRLRYGNS